MLAYTINMIMMLGVDLSQLMTYMLNWISIQRKCTSLLPQQPLAPAAKQQTYRLYALIELCAPTCQLKCLT